MAIYWQAARIMTLIVYQNKFFLMINHSSCILVYGISGRQG